MAAREYSFRRGLKWQLWENVAMLAALPVIVLTLGLVVGVDTLSTVLFAIVLTLIAASFGWENWWIFRNFAERVRVDDAGIQATPFYGAHVRMAWDEIAVRQEYERRDPFRGVFPQMRLVGKDSESLFVLDGEMADFEELAEFVRSKTPFAAPGSERRWWQRVFLPG